MSAELDEYMRLHESAQQAWILFQAALGKLNQVVESANSTPKVLLGNSQGTWPTQNELKTLYSDYSQKRIALDAKHPTLADNERKIAPAPDALEQGRSR